MSFLKRIMQKMIKTNTDDLGLYISGSVDRYKRTMNCIDTNIHVFHFNDASLNIYYIQYYYVNKYKM